MVESLSRRGYRRRRIGDCDSWVPEKPVVTALISLTSTRIANRLDDLYDLRRFVEIAIEKRSVFNPTSDLDNQFHKLAVLDSSFVGSDRRHCSDSGGLESTAEL